MVAHRELSTTRGAARSIHWINRAAYLSPRNAEPHRLAGRALLRLGHTQQGLGEYRLACEVQPSLTSQLADEIMRVTGNPSDVAALGSDRSPAVRELVAGFLLRQKAPELTLRVLEPDAPAETEQGLTLAADAYATLGRLDEAYDRTRALEAMAADRPGPYPVVSENRSARLRGSRRGSQRTPRLFAHLLQEPRPCGRGDMLHTETQFRTRKILSEGFSVGLHHILLPQAWPGATTPGIRTRA